MDLKYGWIDMTRINMVTILDDEEKNNNALEKIQLISQRTSEFKTISNIVSSYKERRAPFYLM